MTIREKLKVSSTGADMTSNFRCPAVMTLSIILKVLKRAERGEIGRVSPQRLQHDEVGTSDSAPNEEWWHLVGWYPF